jgi:hypothetical protein
VSLWTLSKEVGVYIGTMKTRLERAGAKPAFDSAKIGARFYRGTQVGETSQRLERNQDAHVSPSVRGRFARTAGPRSAHAHAAVTFEQARSQIGKGGDKLFPVFLSADEQRDHGKEMEEWRGERFKTAYLPLVRPFSAVPDLLRCVRKAGV